MVGAHWTVVVVTIIIGWHAVWFPQTDNHHQTAFNVRMKKSDTPVWSMLTGSVAYDWIPFKSADECSQLVLYETQDCLPFQWALETAVWGGSDRLRGLNDHSRFTGRLPHFCSFCWPSCLLSLQLALSLPCPTPLPSSLTICWGKDWRTLTMQSQVFSWKILKRSCTEKHMQNEQILSPLGHLGRGVSESHS